jgi:hypothetical protein
MKINNIIFYRQMKKIIFLIFLIFLISLVSCSLQKGMVISKLDDIRLIEKMIFQVNKLYNVKTESAVYIILFAEGRKVQSGEKDYLVSVNLFYFQKMANYVAGENDVYKYSNNIYCAFEKNSDVNFMKYLKRNKITPEEVPKSETKFRTNWDSWLLIFNADKKLEDCSHYECNCRSLLQNNDTKQCHSEIIPFNQNN